MADASRRGMRPRARASGGLLPQGPGGLFVLAVAALAGGLIATGAFQGDGLRSAVVGMFAVLGVLAALAGVARTFRRRTIETDRLGAAALASTGDAMAVVESGNKVVEANAAYRRLCHGGADELPVPETVLARIPGAQALTAELLNAVADSRVHQQSTALDAADPARRLQASVAPLEGPRRVLWTLRLPPEPAPPMPGPPAPVRAQPTATLAAPLASPAPASVLPAASAAAATLVPAMPAAATQRESMRAETLRQEALRHEASRAEARADALVEAWEQAPAGVARLSQRFVRTPSTAFCRMLGYGLTAWEPAGKAIEEVFAPADVAALRGRLARKDAGAEVLAVTLVMQDASRLPGLVALGPSDASGEATVVILPGASRSALPAAFAPPAGGKGQQADQGQAQDREKGEGRFFLNAPLAMALTDAAGAIRSSNAAFDQLFGRSTDAPEVRLADLVGDADGVAVAALLAGAQAGQSAPCDVVRRGEGGRSARLYAAPLGGGEIALCAIDTTEQRTLEAQFAQSHKLQAVGHLAGGVAHDFNNLLTAIIGYCDLLLAKHRPSDPSFPDIMQIKQNANRAAGLVRQLLAFSRRQTLRPQVIELSDVIADVSELLRRLMGERVVLEVEHGRGLWPVKADLNQFEQVIVNLAVNARDAMPDGGTLRLRTRNVPADEVFSIGANDLPPGDYVLVEVEDTGAGIPPDIMDKIFEPFFTTKEVGKGTGLGLATVYGIVQQTGGTILASSVEGLGTTFRVLLPRHEGGPDAEAVPAADARASDLTGQGTVLLVEDEDAVRAFASRALSGRGYDVLTAASGVEALEVMETCGKKLDLVVSDVVMPEMDGPTLLKELRARDPRLKVVFISGYAEDAFARNLPPSEHFAFLPKPFSLKQLVAAVGEALKA
ncbi:hybrid sensor histidine kinase/response regulator [Xanthobacter pseudotagetidis]|uniref:hybrid sensor histidine kinase/response regulator n=1 Tax=Xanthobacter pseudotagetidis TaxID=3119911 RepID=UPI0037295768